MDLSLIAALNNKLDTLDIDDSFALPGLKSVALHVEAAFHHLIRGQTQRDDSAFADVILRANIAFDACVQDAYRALAGRNPLSKSQGDMESYLTGHKIFSSRLLQQFTDYRQTWRALSAIDAPLRVSQSEAFMAITGVSSLAFLLIDRINEHRSYLKSQAQGKSYRQSPAMAPRSDLLSHTAGIVRQFCTLNQPLNSLADSRSEEQLIAAVHGFMTAAAPELSVILRGSLPSNGQYRASLIVIRDGEKVLFELRRNAANDLANLLRQAEQDMSDSGIRYAILFCPCRESDAVRVEEHPIERIRGKLLLFSS